MKLVCNRFLEETIKFFSWKFYWITQYCRMKLVQVCNQFLEEKQIITFSSWKFYQTSEMQIQRYLWWTTTKMRPEEMEASSRSKKIWKPRSVLGTWRSRPCSPPSTSWAPPHRKETTSWNHQRTCLRWDPYRPSLFDHLSILIGRKSGRI